MLAGDGAGALVGLLLGLGVALVWLSLWESPPRPPRSGGPADRVRDLLVQAGVEGVGPRGLAAACAAAGAGTFVVVLGATRVAPVALAFAVIATAAPWALVRGRAQRRRARLREVWPDVVDNLASGVRAGLSLPEAIGQLAERGPEPLRPAFARFAADYRASGRFGDCLDELKDRLADPVGDRVCEALRLTREVGGSDLGRLLRSLSAFLREDARTRGELEARQSWTVNAARLAAAAPWLVLALLATRPQALAPYARPAGAGVLLVGGAVTVVAYRLMLRIGRLPEERRVLR